MSAPGRWHNAIRVRAKPCVHHLVFPEPPAEKFPVRAVDIVRQEYNDGVHLTYINKY